MNCTVIFIHGKGLQHSQINGYYTNTEAACPHSMDRLTFKLDPPDPTIVAMDMDKANYSDNVVNKSISLLNASSQFSNGHTNHKKSENSFTKEDDLYLWWSDGSWHIGASKCDITTSVGRVLDDALYPNNVTSDWEELDSEYDTWHLRKLTVICKYSKIRKILL